MLTDPPRPHWHMATNRRQMLQRTAAGFGGLALSWMLQQDKADDYVCATNETHTIRAFCEECFGLLDLDWQKYVKYDQRYERPSEVELLIGDPAKLKRQIGWEPKVKFKELVRIMTEADLELARRELAYQSIGGIPDGSITPP